MNRLQRLIRIVEQERAAFAEKPTEANRDSMKRCQDRLLAHIAASPNNLTAPFDLFSEPQVSHV